MKNGIVVASILLLCIAVSAPAADPFRYRGFGIDTDLFSLAERFPRSSHQFWRTDGQIKSLPDERDEVRELIRRGTGRYILRLNADESSDHLYYVEADVAEGIVRKLRLSFEKPGNGAIEVRHPACAPVLAGMIRLFGKPQGPRNSWEERLENRTYSWTAPREEMALVCGHYQGRRSVFAMDVVFTRLSH